jgi:hypothetical protein
MTDVSAAVFDGVDQTNPITDSQNYNGGTVAVSSFPFAFASALTVNVGCQALEVINCTHANSSTLRTITYASNWSMSIEQMASSGSYAIRNAVANRAIPTSDTTDTSPTTFSDTALASMTAMSLTAAKATPAVIWSATGLTCGQALSASSLSGSESSVAGTFAFTSPSTIPTAPGTYRASVTFTPTDTANYNTVSGSVDVTVSKTGTMTTVDLTSGCSPCLPTANLTFTATVSPVSPSTATPTGTVQFKSNGNNLGSPVTVDGAGQAQTSSFTASSAGHGNLSITAEYANSDGNFSDSTSGNLAQVVNAPPEAEAFTVSAEKNGPATFLLAKYANDPDGDSLTPQFSGFDQGGSATYASGTVTYTPANNFTGTETFSYTVTDPFGASSASVTVTAEVSVPTGSGANIVWLTKVDNAATVIYAGIPGATYSLQYTVPSPISWQDVGGTSTTDAGGRGTLTDSNATDPSRWYRTKYVSGP